MKLRGTACLILLCAAIVRPQVASPSSQLTIGETFTIDSSVMKERRRINVYIPPTKPDTPLPIMYMPDGGMAEDFLHIAGLIQVLVGNGTMRPFMLVGIENTQRRRDMTGPTNVESDKKVAPVVGGSAVFRSLIRTELIPEIDRRYKTTPEKAIVGESLAGLFVVETLLLEPELFDSYVAIDPSVWWNGEELVKKAGLSKIANQTKPTLYLTSSDEAVIAAATRRMADRLKREASLRIFYEPMPEEKHSTIYHPAAIKAFRKIFAPATK